MGKIVGDPGGSDWAKPGTADNRAYVQHWQKYWANVNESMTPQRAGQPTNTSTSAYAPTYTSKSSRSAPVARRHSRLGQLATFVGFVLIVLAAMSYVSWYVPAVYGAVCFIWVLRIVLIKLALISVGVFLVYEAFIHWK